LLLLLFELFGAFLFFFLFLAAGGFCGVGFVVGPAGCSCHSYIRLLTLRLFDFKFEKTFILKEAGAMSR
jgi:hypothetical protein